MDRRLFLFGAAAIASSSFADNPFVASDPIECHNPFVAPDPIKVIDPVVSKPPKKKTGIIEFYTMDPCIHCDVWKREVMPKCMNAGWKIEIHEGGKEVYPSFVLWNGGRKYTHSGYMSVEAMRKLLKGEKVDASQSPVKSTPSKPAATPVKTRSRSCPNCPPNIRGYRAKWTYPGSLRRHLAGSPHFIDVTGWTMDQMEYAHDQHHNMMRRVGGYVPYV